MLKRRLLTIPGIFALAVAGLVTAPLWIPALALVDLLRPAPRTALRCGLFFQYFALCEVVGLLASAGVPLLPGGHEQSQERHFRLEWWWGSAVLDGATRIFGMRFEIEGAEHVRQGPLLLFLRHASMGDTVIAARYISRPYGLRLRYVLKRELLWDPCLDVVGHRLPNVFVDRASDAPEDEIRAIAELARDLGDQDGVLIYPEGTRFTPARRAALVERLKDKGRDELAARADALHHVLPPRTGGPLALIKASPGSDVVFCAHHGFEGGARFSSLWQGALVRRRVRIRFWRVPAAEIPGSPEERERWLFEQWGRIDAWLGELEAAEQSERAHAAAAA